MKLDLVLCMATAAYAAPTAAPNAVTRHLQGARNAVGKGFQDGKDVVVAGANHVSQAIALHRLGVGRNRAQKVAAAHQAENAVVASFRRAKEKFRQVGTYEKVVTGAAVAAIAAAALSQTKTKSNIIYDPEATGLPVVEETAAPIVEEEAQKVPNLAEPAPKVPIEEEEAKQAPNSAEPAPQAPNSAEPAPQAPNSAEPAPQAPNSAEPAPQAPNSGATYKVPNSAQTKQ
jgi:hypothetical protein